MTQWRGLWVGWIVLGGLLHLGSTLLGGRGSMQGALNITAWATLPFALRDLLQTVYMLSASHAITSPGLSGFATSAFMTQVLLTALAMILIDCQHSMAGGASLSLLFSLAIFGLACSLVVSLG